MKLKLLLSILLAFTTLLTSCNKTEDNVVKVGTIAGPESELMEVAKRVAKERYGLKVEIVTFTDYTMPNEALNSGSIDANMFQHVPYLNEQIKQQNYKIVMLGKGFIFPMGVYSKKLTNISEINDGDKIAIPNDPSNEARALLLIEKAGLIKLTTNAGTKATIKDILRNPKHLEFIEIDASQLPRALADVDAAVITNTFAVAAGLELKNAIFKEGDDSLYANVLVVRAEDIDNPKLHQLLYAFQSEPVINKAKELFGDGAIPAFTPTSPGK